MGAATLARFTGEFSRLIGWRNRSQQRGSNWHPSERRPLGRSKACRRWISSGHPRAEAPARRRGSPEDQSSPSFSGRAGLNHFYGLMIVRGRVWIAPPAMPPPNSLAFIWFLCRPLQSFSNLCKRSRGGAKQGGNRYEKRTYIAVSPCKLVAGVGFEPTTFRL